MFDIKMTLDGKPFKIKDFDKVMDQSIHDQVAPQIVNFLMKEIEKAKKGVDINSISFDASNLKDLGLSNGGHVQKRKIMKFVARKLTMRGMRVVHHPNSLEIRW